MFSMDSQYTGHKSKLVFHKTQFLDLFLLYINDLPTGLNTNFKFLANLVTFTEETLNGKLHFLYCEYCTGTKDSILVRSKEY